MNPTVEQALESVYVCQMLSNLLRNIELFRFDERTKEIFIIAGDELQVVIPSTGTWQFYEEP